MIETAVDRLLRKGGVPHAARSCDGAVGPLRAIELALVAGARPAVRGFLRLARETDQRKNDCGSGACDWRRFRNIELADSRFGMNHAFGWPDMLTLCRQAGIGCDPATGR